MCEQHIGRTGMFRAAFLFLPYGFFGVCLAACEPSPTRGGDDGSRQSESKGRAMPGACAYRWQTEH